MLFEVIRTRSMHRLRRHSTNSHWCSNGLYRLCIAQGPSAIRRASDSEHTQLLFF